MNKLAVDDSHIIARNLTKVYKTKKTRLKALSNVDVDIKRGEFVSIVGTSGSGKSTLLSLLAGLDKPSRGRIIIDGVGVHRASEEKLVKFRRENTGFIFQSFNLFDVLTAQENVAFPLMIMGVKRSLRMKRAHQVLEELGLAEHIHHKPNELSGGQQQRVSIARAIISNPSIIFADEPTGNLDSVTADSIMDLLHRIKEEKGTTILMVTHDSNIASNADRIIRIEDGRVVSPELLTSNDKVCE